MRGLRRIVLEEAILAAGSLIGAWYLLYYLTVWGLQDEIRDGPLKAYIMGPGVHVEMVMSGLCFGVVVAVVNHITQVPRFRHQSFGRIVLLKTGFFLVGLVLAVTGVQAVLLAFVYTPQELAELRALTSPRLMVSLGIWLLMAVTGANLLLEVRRKMGPGKLWALLTGRYHRPRDEERIFLFLDLKGSTTITETLGHNRYSQLLRACYHDLTEYVLKSGAEIYQFVGDEVVLTWPADRPGAGRESLRTFFAFQSRLRQRKSWYEASFGVAPEFRGGIEGGVVTATEVGDIKREIAFHGDPLNIAARLLELCGQFQRPVLISERIRETIDAEPNLSTTLEGEIVLRGKTHPISVFGVTERVSTLA